MRFDEFDIPDECPRCHSLQFIPSRTGDVACGRCGSIVAKWYDWFEASIPQEY